MSLDVAMSQASLVGGLCWLTRRPERSFAIYPIPWCQPTCDHECGLFHLSICSGHPSDAPIAWSNGPNFHVCLPKIPRPKPCLHRSWNSSPELAPPETVPETTPEKKVAFAQKKKCVRPKCKPEVGMTVLPRTDGFGHTYVFLGQRFWADPRFLGARFRARCWVTVSATALGTVSGTVWGTPTFFGGQRLRAHPLCFGGQRFWAHLFLFWATVWDRPIFWGARPLFFGHGHFCRARSLFRAYSPNLRPRLSNLPSHCKFTPLPYHITTTSHPQLASQVF